MQKRLGARLMTMVEPNIDRQPVAADEPQLRDLFLFTARDRTFGVPADEVEGTAEAKCATPLPHAPAAILGVVYARGRVLTLIDPGTVTGDDWSRRGLIIPAIICLRSDEQLALAADAIVETITISSSDIELADRGDNEQLSAVAGILRHGGERIIILDPPRLFDAAVQRRERRRRRF